MYKIHLDNLEHYPISDPFIQLHLQSLLPYMVTVTDFQNEGVDLPIFSLWRGIFQAFSGPAFILCSLSLRKT